jgi:predicted MFS family arabinose efflux permease
MQMDWRRVGVVAAGMCPFFNMYVTQALLPELCRTFGASIAAVSLTVTVSTLAVAASAPFAGGLADRFGRKPVMVTAMCLLMLATFGAATARDLPQLLFWRALQGVCVPGVFASIVAYISEEWAASEAPTVAALYVAGGVFGGFSGRFLSGLVAADWGWRSAFVLLGIMNAACLPVVACLLPASRKQIRTRSLLASLAGAGNHFRNSPLVATFGVGFAILFAQVATFTYVNFLLSAPPYGLGTQALSYVFFVFLIGMVITPFTGRLSQRWSAREVGFAAFVIAGSGLILTLGHSLAHVIAGLVLLSCGNFIVQAQSMATVPMLARGSRSAAVGLYNVSYYIGGSAGATLPSVFWARAGWPGCIALILMVQLVAMILVVRNWPGRRRPQSAAGSATAAATQPAQPRIGAAA